MKQKKRYVEFDKWMTDKFSEYGTIYLQYHQFYFRTQSMNQNINVTKLPNHFNGSNVTLQQLSGLAYQLYSLEKSQFMYDSSNLMSVTIQFKIWALKSVESVFQQYFLNRITRQSIDVC